MTGRIGVSPLGVHVAAGMLCLMGCASTPPSEELGEVAEAFGTSSCSTAAPDQVFNGFIPPTSSPQGYTTCFRGYVVDLITTNQPSVVRVKWGDSVPSTQTACEKTWGAAILYTKDGGNWVNLSGLLETYGTWSSGSCVTPRFNLDGLQALHDYRVAVTMRPKYGGDTRVVNLHSEGSGTGGTTVGIGGTGSGGVGATGP